jgi:ribosomal protein L44E
MAQPPEVIARQAALTRGLKHYFTGKPCPHGHVAKRIVANYHCVECKNDSQRRYHARRLAKQSQIPQNRWVANEQSAPPPHGE